MILFNLLLTLTALCIPPGHGKIINSHYVTGYDAVTVIEKVYLHTDRDSYFPGDDIWFKAYLIDAYDRLLCDHSNNLHVELISPALNIIDSRIIRLDKGMGNGDFSLSGKLASGSYLLRAYTNYMRNFGDQLFFNKYITIVNPSDAGKTFMENTGDNKENFEITFFPEGGALVDSIPSVVAFKAVDASGSSCDISGEIYSSTGELITAFRSTHKGMGTFQMIPLPGLSYFASAVNKKGNKIQTELPAAFRSGISMSLMLNANNKRVVLLKTNASTLPSIINKELSLTVSAHNEILKTIDLKLNSLNNFLTLPVDDLPDGIFLLTLSGPEKIPCCERLFYIQNSEDVGVKLNTDKTVYNKRDSVSVKISVKNNSQMDQDIFLSLAATNEITEGAKSEYQSNICSWFLLESEVIGPVEEPTWYFDPANPDRLKNLDLLLLTQGWRDFKWKYKNQKFPVEDGFEISGKVRKKFSDKIPENTSFNIALFTSSTPLVFTIPADTSGRFKLEGIDFTGDARLIVSVTGEDDKLKGMIVLDSLSYNPAEITENIVSSEHQLAADKNITEDESQNGSLNLKENLHYFIQYAEVRNSISKKYKLSDTIRPGEVTVTAVRKDSPKAVYERAKHNLLGTPEKSILVTQKEEKYGSVRQFIRSDGTIMWGLRNIAYVLDGVKISADQFMSVPMSIIERIDILNTLASASVWGGESVIAITTRSDWSGNTINKVYHTTHENFKGYNEPRVFYSPKHHSKLESDFKPDLRTTLYWKPDIILTNNKEMSLDFFNADNQASVTVTVEGITSTGIPVAAKTKYVIQ